MISEEELKHKYRSASLGELVNIVDHPGEYIPEAVKVAQAEMKRRRLDEEDIKNYKTQMVSEKQIRQLHAASLKLSFWHKALFYFGSLFHTFLGYAFKQNFKEDEAVLKLRQASFFKWSGVIVIIITLVLSLWLDLNTIASVVIWVIGFFISISIDKKLHS